MDPDKFEDLVKNLLNEIGFEIDEETAKSHKDGGIDVRGTLIIGGVIRIKMAVQVKRGKSNIQAPTVQQVRGSLRTHEQGLIITTSQFSKEAREEAETQDKTPIALMNGEALIELLMEHKVGVTLSKLELFEIDDEI